MKSKNNLSRFFKTVGYQISKHSPEILTGIGIAGMITTTVLAVKATPKAIKLLEHETDLRLKFGKRDEDENVEGLVKVADNKKGDYGHYRLPVKDAIATTWKCYIPAAVTCIASAACLIGASKVNLRRNAALAAAYKLSETTLQEYKEQVVEAIGEKKEDKIHEKVNNKRIQENPVGRNEVIITGQGETLCYDHSSGRYFKSDIDKIKRAVNKLNERMLCEGYVSLNDYYDLIGLGETEIGDILGWNTDMKLVEVRFYPQLDENDNPCLAVEFVKAPKYEYDKFF